MSDMKAETVAAALYSGWIARFGVPEYITTGQGRQFESMLFKELSIIFGIDRIRATAYNPRANGIIERTHRFIKAALMCRTNSHWVDELLGLRSVVKEDIGATMAEMVYGENLRLPGQFFELLPYQQATSEFFQDLRRHFDQIQPTVTSNHSTPLCVFVPKQLSKCAYVFVRHDAVRKSLQPPFDGPFRVIKREKKHFVIRIRDKDITIGIDLLKPAFGIKEDVATSPTPESGRASGSGTSVDAPSSMTSTSLEPALTSSTDLSSKTTRSGRHVHFPQRFR